MRPIEPVPMMARLEVEGVTTENKLDVLSIGVATDLGTNATRGGAKWHEHCPLRNKRVKPPGKAEGPSPKFHNDFRTICPYASA